MGDLDRELTRDELETLGRYNAERHRGLVHDRGYAAGMSALQRRFDARQARLTREIDEADAQIEFLRRTALPRWFVWLCLAAAVAGVLASIIQAVVR